MGIAFTQGVETRRSHDKICFFSQPDHFRLGCGDESTEAGVVVVTDASMIDDLDQGSDMADSLDAATQTRDQSNIDAVADAASDTGDGGALDLGPDMMVVTACADAIDNDGDDRID